MPALQDDQEVTYTLMQWLVIDAIKKGLTLLGSIKKSLKLRYPGISESNLNEIANDFLTFAKLIEAMKFPVLEEFLKTYKTGDELPLTKEFVFELICVFQMGINQSLLEMNSNQKAGVQFVETPLEANNGTFDYIQIMWNHIHNQFVHVADVSKLIKKVLPGFEEPSQETLEEDYALALVQVLKHLEEDNAMEIWD